MIKCSITNYLTRVDIFFYKKKTHTYTVYQKKKHTHTYILVTNYYDDMNIAEKTEFEKERKGRDHFYLS